MTNALSRRSLLGRSLLGATALGFLGARSLATSLEARAAEHLAKASAVATEGRRADVKNVFDMRRDTRKADQDDRKMTLETLTKIFDSALMSVWNSGCASRITQ